MHHGAHFVSNLVQPRTEFDRKARLHPVVPIALQEWFHVQDILDTKVAW